MNQAQTPFFPPATVGSDSLRAAVTSADPSRALRLEDLSRLIKTTVDDLGGTDDTGLPSRVVVPAAGKGSRFGADTAKPLAKGNGERELLLRVLDCVSSFDANPVVVVNTATGDSIKATVAADARHQPTWCTQVEQRGMGDAVRTARSVLGQSPCDLLVIWSDIGAIDPRLVRSVGAIHRLLNSPMTMATCWVTEPYIAVERTESGHPHRVLQRREGDHMPATGETDCGFFWVRSPEVFTWIDHLEQVTPDGREVNFLPILEWAATSGEHPPIAVNVVPQLRAYGVNTPEELVIADRAWVELCSVLSA